MLSGNVVVGAAYCNATALLGCPDDVEGLLGHDTTPGGFDFGFSCALASGPRLSSGRAVFGNVIANNSTGSSMRETVASARRRSGAKAYR